RRRKFRDRDILRVSAASDGADLHRRDVLYPMDQAPEVLRFYRKYAEESPDDLTAHAALMTTPDGHDVVAIVVAWFGLRADAAKHLDPLRRFGAPVADLIGDMSYPQLQTMLDPAVPIGIR